MGVIGFFLPLALMFAIFYFLIIKPQNKERDKMYQLQSSLEKGDKIVTNAGIVGVVDMVLKDSDCIIIKSEGSKLKLKKEVVVYKEIKEEENED